MPEQYLMSKVDWFIPASLRTDVASLWRLRIFVVSHLLGPCLGTLIMVYLYDSDLHHDAPFWIIVNYNRAWHLTPPFHSM